MYWVYYEESDTGERVYLSNWRGKRFVYDREEAQSVIRVQEQKAHKHGTWNMDRVM
jgi:hypothetical protein